MLKDKPKEMENEFTYIEEAVKSLVGSPWIAPTLMSKGDRDIEHANGTLNR